MRVAHPQRLKPSLGATLFVFRFSKGTGWCSFIAGARGGEEGFIAQKACDAKPYLTPQTPFGMTGVGDGAAGDSIL